jgi:hypothetical protein
MVESVEMNACIGLLLCVQSYRLPLRTPFQYTLVPDSRLNVYLLTARESQAFPSMKIGSFSLTGIDIDQYTSLMSPSTIFT